MTEYEQVREFLQKNHPEDSVYSRFDEEVIEWVDEDWDEDTLQGGYENESEWYNDHGCGEAEAGVRVDLSVSVGKELGIKVYSEEWKNQGKSFVDLLEELYQFITWR